MLNRVDLIMPEYMMYLNELEAARGFGEVFSLVKMAVSERLRLHRAGLALVLMDLPPNVLAQHQIGSNAIVVDKKVIDAIDSTSTSRLKRNSYVFVILLHEYLHSLGITDEERVRALVLDVVGYTFPGNQTIRAIALNPAIMIADRPITSTQSKTLPLLVRDFDRESMPYIG